MPIPSKVLSKILEDPYYQKCSRSLEKSCHGRITFEHVWIYAGKQIQEVWAIIPLCEYHHDVCTFQDGGDLKKELNQYISLMRVSDEDLEKYPRVNWKQKKEFLKERYKNYKLC